MNDPCLSCPLPDCDESSPRCPLRAEERDARARKWAGLTRMERIVRSLESERCVRINAALRAMRAAA
jgi:hypothetical protein